MDYSKINIKYIGKYIDQYKDTKHKFAKTFSKDEKEKINDYIYSKKKTKEEKLKELQNIFSNEDMKFILYYESNIRSFNKNKGVWLEKLFSQILDNNNSFEEITNTWIDGVIFNFLTSIDIKINSKSFKHPSIIQFKEVNNIKSLTFYYFNLDNIHSKIINYREYIKEVIIKPLLFIDKELYEYKILFKKKLDKEVFFKIMQDLKGFYNVDLKKLRTDNIIKDKKENVFILELKNNDSKLRYNNVYACCSYGIREKVFNHSKFNKLFLVHKGPLEPNFLEKLTEMNINLKDRYKFEICPIFVNEFIGLLKEKYFDSPKSTKKNSKVFDIDKVVFTKNNVMSTYYENRGDDIIYFDINYLFEYNEKPKKINLNQDNREKEFLKIGRAIENGSNK